MTATPSDMSRAVPPVSPEELSAAARRLYTTGPALRRKLQHFRPYICPFEHLLPHIPQGAAVLDVGCGGGLFLALLADSGKLEGGGRGVGFDISAGAIEMAQRMVERAPLVAGMLQFQTLLATDAWPQGDFDVVSMVDVMHHIPPSAQQIAFEQAALRVRPGGVLLYKDMADRAGWKSIANRLHDLVLARQWINYASIETVESWANSIGLELTHREDINRLWYAHELRVFRRPA